LINKAIQPYNLGSIFKIIIAEAAFENKIVKETDGFTCTGQIDVDGQMKRCATHANRGRVELNFENAFAESCNTVFIQTGLKVGYKNIVETARKFGLGQSIGLDKDGLQEDPGLIEYNKYVSNREVANLSIGQGSLLVTPLQVANLLSIVANDGVQRKVNIVDSIVDDEGKVVKNIKEINDTVIFSKDNIQRVKKMMEKVTEEGTGTEANLKEYGGVAGKTSSAETGIYNGNEQIIHAWFGGYFPQKNPRYAMALIIENGKSGSHAAAPIFREIAYNILSLGY
jgi:peptidoglycan glycosyltransferase/penicillin-binding protein 2